MIDFDKLANDLRPASPATLEAIVTANAHERNDMIAALRKEGRAEGVIVLSPGMSPAGHRFNRIHVSMSIRHRIHCSDQHFDQWFDEQVRTRLSVDGEIIQTQ